MSDVNSGKELFWRLAKPFLDEGLVQRGTIMGRPCIRVAEVFVAMPHSKTGKLIVKLPEQRVRALISEHVGETFAPGGRVFKQWLAVSNVDETLWSDLIAEALRSTDES